MLLAAAACHPGIRGSGNEASEHRQVAAFTEVEARGAVDLDIKNGPVNVDVSGDDNLVPKLQTRVEGSRLVIDTEGLTMSPKLPLRVSLAAPDLRRVAASGAVHVEVHGDRPALAIKLSGAGTIGGDGRADDLDLAISGAGNANLERLAVKHAKVDISGAGRASLDEPAELIVDISGAGSVSYGGSPKIEKHISGVGSVSHR